MHAQHWICEGIHQGELGFSQIDSLQFGLDLASTNQIMVCVKYDNYEIIINGSHTNLFRGIRGLIHGFPLSPILFLLIMEGPSKIVEEYRDKGVIQGISISTIIIIIHILFIDDVMLFENGTFDEWHVYKCIFENFHGASRMLICDNKSIILYHGVEKKILSSVLTIGLS